MQDIGQEIQQHLSQYLRGEIQLYQFEDWFAPVLWDIDDCEDTAARQLAGEIHILISEFSNGDRSPEAFREGLENAVRQRVSISH